MWIKKKYKDDIHELARVLEEKGIVVFEPNFDEVVLEDSFYSSVPITKSVFKGLTLEHFDWIRKSDVCFIYNKDNYAGVSVSMEMGFSSALSKPIYALTDTTGNPSRDALIDKVASTADELARLLQ